MDDLTTVERMHRCFRYRDLLLTFPRLTLMYFILSVCERRYRVESTSHPPIGLWIDEPLKGTSVHHSVRDVSKLNDVRFRDMRFKPERLVSEVRTSNSVENFHDFWSRRDELRSYSHVPLHVISLRRYLILPNLIFKFVHFPPDSDFSPQNHGKESKNRRATLVNYFSWIPRSFYFLVFENP